MSPGATTYHVTRSTDQVTYSALATVVSPEYLDSAVTLGTAYFYKVNAANSDGTSPFTAPQSVVPTPTGELCLGQIRLMAQQRADRVNSQFLTLPEWNANINNSYFELYDLLVTTYEDYFMAPVLTFTADGTSTLYPLPNGTNYSAAAPFYKLMGVDIALNAANNAFLTIHDFNFAERNQFAYVNSLSTPYGIVNLKYRVIGSNIEFIPTPAGNQQIRLWYVPRLAQLLKDTDTTSSGVSGWMEYVIVDAAIKALQKEESDVSVLMAQKGALIARIQSSAQNRDAGEPSTISDTRGSGNGWGGWGNGGGWNWGAG